MWQEGMRNYGLMIERNRQCRDILRQTLNTKYETLNQTKRLTGLVRMVCKTTTDRAASSPLGSKRLRHVIVNAENNVLLLQTAALVPS